MSLKINILIEIVCKSKTLSQNHDISHMKDMEVAVGLVNN